MGEAATCMNCPQCFAILERAYSCASSYGAWKPLMWLARRGAPCGDRPCRTLPWAEPIDRADTPVGAASLASARNRINDTLTRRSPTRNERKASVGGMKHADLSVSRETCSAPTTVGDCRSHGRNVSRETHQRKVLRHSRELMPEHPASPGLSCSLGSEMPLGCKRHPSPTRHDLKSVQPVEPGRRSLILHPPTNALHRQVPSTDPTWSYAC